jgi:predicted RNA methylase
VHKQPVIVAGGGEAMAARRKKKTKQNTSHAVMAQRAEAADSLDDFPTPPWATRALIEHVIGSTEALKSQSCFDPACGAGHMAKVLMEYFSPVYAADIHKYGYGAVADFLTSKRAGNRKGNIPWQVDWIITNPPFRLGENFLEVALRRSRVGVALLARTVFLESVGRYERVFRDNPPSRVAQFTERVPMVKGRLDRRASTATGYAWLVWEKEQTAKEARLVWIPPCRKRLERDSDYEAAPALTQVASQPKLDEHVPQPDLFVAA